MISGHWDPRRVDNPYLDMLRDKGVELARLHRELLPLSDVDFAAEGVGRRCSAITTPSGRYAPTLQLVVPMPIPVRNPDTHSHLEVATSPHPSGAVRARG